MKKNLLPRALMLTVGLALPCLGYSQDNGDAQQIGVSSEVVSWQFLVSGRVIATNVFEQWAAINREASLGIGVEFKVTDEMTNTLVRGRMMRFADYARLYSGFYTEITTNHRPLPTGTGR